MRGLGAKRPLSEAPPAPSFGSRGFARLSDPYEISVSLEFLVLLFQYKSTRIEIFVDFSLRSHRMRNVLFLFLFWKTKKGSKKVSRWRRFCNNAYFLHLTRSKPFRRCGFLQSALLFSCRNFRIAYDAPRTWCFEMRCKQNRRMRGLRGRFFICGKLSFCEDDRFFTPRHFVT